jgi:hypothetical protein
MADERIFQKDGDKITTSFGAVFIEGESLPCTQGSQWLEIPLESISEKDGKISIDHSSMKGQAPGHHFVDKAGKHSICLFE